VAGVLPRQGQPGLPSHSPRLAITAFAVAIKILRSNIGERDWT
jgi:hypothetical protein